MHKLASSYHWTKDYIFDFIYLDEALDYIDEIRKQGIIDNLNALFIAHNPNSKQPKELMDMWLLELKKLEGRSIIELENDLPEEGAFDKLRSMLGQTSKKRKK